MRGICGAPRAVCGIVVIMSDTFPPVLAAGSNVGENVGVALGGIGDAENVTVLLKAPLEGATANVKVPG